MTKGIITIFLQSNKSVLDLIVVEYHLGMEDLATQVKKKKQSSLSKIMFNLFFTQNNEYLFYDLRNACVLIYVGSLYFRG